MENRGIIMSEEITLTRDQAIKRIRDIRKGSQEDHHCHPTHPADAAAKELMAIFDIKEEEL